MKSKVKVVQISNIAPQATKDQMSSLFSYVGKIEDIRLYPTVRDVLIPVQSRICFIKFQDRDSVPVAQHLTNTVFIDRSLAVIPYHGGEFPDEKCAMDILHSNGPIAGLATDAKWPTHVTNHVCIEGSIVRTVDPKLAENGFPDYPNLPSTTESYKVNEIRRTVTLDNINPKATAEDILALGETVGEVKYVKMGAEKDGSINCLLEFSELSYVIPAMKLHNKDFMGQPLIVNHATTSIAKPLIKSNDEAQAEIEEAMKRVKDVQTSLFNSNMDPLAFLDVSVKDKFSLSRSRSRSRRRSRSKSRSSRARRRSRSRGRSKSRSRSRKHRSTKRRSHSRSRRSRRSRSKSRSKTEHSRKEKESKSKASESTESSIDAIAELISKELQKENESDKKEPEYAKMEIESSKKEIESSKKETESSKKETESSKKEIESSKREIKSSRREKDDKHKESRRRRSNSRSKSRDRHRRRSRSRRSRSKGRGRKSRSRTRRSRSRSRRKRSKERHRSRSPISRRRHSGSPSRKRRHRRERSRSSEKHKKERKSSEPKKISRNYDEEDEMYSEEKKTESTDSKKEEAIDMDISD